MSSFDRRSLLILPLALAACGFSPVYAPGGTAAGLHGQAEVQELRTTEGYLLVRNLEDRLGRGGQPAYRLDLTLKTQSHGQAITASNDITRFSLEGTVDYVLRRLGSEGDAGIVASGQVDNFTGYSATGTTVEALAAERDASERLMQILAEQLTVELYALADLSA